MIVCRRPRRNKWSSLRTNLPLSLLLCFSVVAPASPQAQTSSIRIDEEVLFFPGFAVEAGSGWTAHVEFLENRTLGFKLDAIDRLMRLFPKRRFVLVGDSGELDPEVYAKLVARFPGQVVAILIRDVRGESLESPRFVKLFGSLPSGIDRRVFRSTSELAGFRP
jgi:Uncharacterized conserved protein (DUF2183)